MPRDRHRREPETVQARQDSQSDLIEEPRKRRDPFYRDRPNLVVIQMDYSAERNALLNAIPERAQMRLSLGRNSTGTQHRRLQTHVFVERRMEICSYLVVDDFAAFGPSKFVSRPLCNVAHRSTRMGAQDLVAAVGTHFAPYVDEERPLG